MSTGADKVFAGSIPRLYDEYLVPLIFQPYADDLARRVAECSPAHVLEIAAGTGVATRAMASALPAGAAIVATDLNAPMMEHARAIGTARPVQWRQADAMQLPFPDESFDVVACQFGVMFFPDKQAAFKQALRVLRPGGAFIFNAWDRIEDNEFADTATQALAKLFPADAPLFLRRTPHGYHEKGAIERDVSAAGFTRIEITTRAETSRADSPRRPAVAYCQGTPLRNEIEARDPAALERATEAAAQAIAARFGGGAVEGRIQAHIVLARRASLT